MTNIEVVYRCALQPTEEAMRALGYVREVYGVRRITYSMSDSIVRAEYDATRLSKSTISKLLRGAGFALTEEVSLLSPQRRREDTAASPAPK